MKEELQANGNTATIYDVNIHAHTLSSMVLRAVWTAGCAAAYSSLNVEQ